MDGYDDFDTKRLSSNKPLLRTVKIILDKKLMFLFSHFAASDHKPRLMPLNSVPGHDAQHRDSCVKIYATKPV